MDNSETVKKRMEWMLLSDTLSPLYKTGIAEFLDFAFRDFDDEDELPCPCKDCYFSKHKNKEDTKSDLLGYGMVKSYVCWIYHGEFTPLPKKARKDVGENSHDDMFGMIHAALGHNSFGNDDMNDSINSPRDGNKEPKKPSFTPEHFENLIKDAKKQLYPGCSEFSKLSFIVKLFQIKCVDGLSNKAFTNLLKLVKVALLGGETLPSTYHEAMKIIQDLGLRYEKIDACENDCILYYKENANRQVCPVCGLSRCKNSKTSIKKPRKVLRYFPLKPRLQRMFMSPETSNDLRWHFESRDKDGILRHPADSKAWEALDEIDSFGSEPRNIRLGLASDGFNPFGQQRSDYSTWPVVLSIYNLPPWMFMKQPHLMLSLLIPGPKAPGNNIDVYLRPLIDDLKDLWECGVETFDASKKEYFILRAAVLWTINDFPAYANLSGWSTKGYMACPICGKDTSSFRLPNCAKICYMHFRRFLSHDHKWRDSKTFDGKVHKTPPPKPLSGEEMLAQMSGLENMKFGKNVKHPKRSDNWRKISIFFELPYWSKLLLRHNLDVMHIEKNVFENIIGTLLDIEGKSKDHLKARHDLKKLGIRRNLHPKLVDGKWHIPPAMYTLSPTEKDKVCTFLEEVKVPDGYSSNFSKCIKKRKVSGLKTHDCHVLLEQLLPLAIRGVSCQQVYDVVVEISTFFKELCSKALKLQDLDRLEEQIVITLCKFEKIFLPSFFDVMVHLVVHLVREAKIGGPVQSRWMYPIERFLGKLKDYVRNKARPEGSIAEGYILEECLFFCSKYLYDIETKHGQQERNSDGVSDEYEGLSIFAPSGLPLGKEKSKCLSEDEFRKAKDYVLKNCDEAQPFIREYEEGMHDKEFSDWFRDRVDQLTDIPDQVANDLRILAMGPLMGVERYTGYLANGFRFHIKALEDKRINQNSGVSVEGVGASDVGKLEYYGFLNEIISLQYLNGKRVVLFNCDWWDVHHIGKGIKVDKHGIVSVNANRRFKTDEPYILACQAQQVFYVRDGFNPNWLIVIKTLARHNYDASCNHQVVDQCKLGGDIEACQQHESRTTFQSVEGEEDISHLSDTRDDIQVLVLEANKDNEPKPVDGEESELPSEDSGDEIVIFDDSEHESSDSSDA